MPSGRRIIFLSSLALMVLSALTVAACGDDDDATAASAGPKTPSGQAATVGVEDSGLGKILVDSQSRTLYLFQKDSGTKSACFGACARDWPPLRTNGKPTVDGGAKASLVATTPRSDGKPQVTYSGHPVYLFEGDTKAGDTNGQGLTAFGGGWFALSPAGDQVSGEASTSGGNGAY